MSVDEQYDQQADQGNQAEQANQQYQSPSMTQLIRLAFANKQSHGQDQLSQIFDRARAAKAVRKDQDNGN